MFKKPHKSIYLNAVNEANHMMKSGHDGCAAISISIPPMIAFQRWLSMRYYCWKLGTLKDWPMALKTLQKYLLKCSQRGQSYDEEWSWWMRGNININATSDCNSDRVSIYRTLRSLIPQWSQYFEFFCYRGDTIYYWTWTNYGALLHSYMPTISNNATSDCNSDQANIYRT